MRVVQEDLPSSSPDCSSADICQSAMLQAQAKPKPQPEKIIEKNDGPATATSTTASTPKKQMPTISVVVTPAGKEPEEDVAVLPEQDPEIEFVKNQLTDAEPIMPPSPGNL
jgi:hypothetical protein